MTISASDVSDHTLLQRLMVGRDATAVAELVRRYAGLVYGACLRRQPPALAAPTCEAVFQDLIAQPGRVTGLVPVWLHAAVLARTGNGPGCVPPAASDDWAAVAPHFDVALNALDPAERWHLLIAYGTLPPREQAVGQQGDVDAALVGDRGAILGRLAQALATTGVATTPEALAAVLEVNVIEPLPAAVSGRLGCLALAVLPTRMQEAENPALGRVRQYLGGAIAVLILVIAIAIVVSIISEKVVPAPGAKPPKVLRGAG